MKSIKILATLGLLVVAGTLCVSPLAHAVDPSATVKLTVEAEQTITWSDDPSGSGNLPDVNATIKPGQVTNVPYAHSVTIKDSNNTKYGYTLNAYGNGDGSSKNALYDGIDSIQAVSGKNQSLSSNASAWGVQVTDVNSGALSNSWTGIGASSSSPVAIIDNICKNKEIDTRYFSYGFAAANSAKGGNYIGKIVYSIVQNVE